MALFITVKMWNHPVDRKKKWLKKVWCLSAGKYYLVKKKNKRIPFAEKYENYHSMQNKPDSERQMHVFSLIYGIQRVGGA